MRETRYLWINNFSANPSEDDKHDIKTVLESHGKIQSVRYVESGDSGNGIVVAFMDVKSATKALEYTNKLTNGHRLNLEYCESTGLRNSSVLSTNECKSQGNTNNPSIENKIDDKKRKSPDKILSNRSRSSSLSSSDTDHSLSSSHRQRNRLNDRKNVQAARWRTDKYRSSEEHNIGQRGLRVTQLPLRSTDTSIREGLFHEYKKHGKITSVIVEGQGPNRISIITFKKPDDMEKAFDDSKEKIFFASSINVERHSGFDVEDPDLCPPEIALDEFHPKATKTLFVGNLPTDLITDKELLKAFEKFGTIIDLDIKQQTNQPGTSYAFIQYSDIRSVVRALNSSTMTRVCGKAVKLGFGKSQPTNCIWLANLSERIKDHHLSKHFSHFGTVTKILLDDEYLSALVFFASVESAQKALIETKNRTLVGQKVHIDFASIEFQRYFLNRSDIHWMVSPGNNENYREYSNCNYYNFPYERNPYPEERNRRHFEEIRLSDDPYRRLERQPSYRDYDNQNVKSRSRYNEEIRSNTSASGKKHNNSKEHPDAPNYLFTNRIRSESPYSVKGSRSRERESVRDNNSKSPHRSSKDRSSRSRSSRNRSIHQLDEHEEVIAAHPTRERNGHRNSGSNSRSHSHRSNSVSNKGGRDSVTLRGGGVDCGSSGTSGNPDSSNSEDSPYFSSGYSDSYSGHHNTTGITRPNASLSSSVVGDVTSSTVQQPTTDRLNYLEQERIQLIMELKRLDSGSDPPPVASPSLLTNLKKFDVDSDDGKFSPPADFITQNESSKSNRTDTQKDCPIPTNGLIDHPLEKFDIPKELEESKFSVSTTLNCAVSKSTTITSSTGCDYVNSFSSSIRNVCDNDSDRLHEPSFSSTDSPSPSSLRLHSTDNIIASAASSTTSTPSLAKSSSSQIQNVSLPDSRNVNCSISSSLTTNIPIDASPPPTARTDAFSLDEKSSRESPSLRDPRLKPQNYLLKSHSVCESPLFIKSPDNGLPSNATLKSSPITPILSVSCSDKGNSPDQSGSVLSSSSLGEKQKFSDCPSPCGRVGDCELSDNEDDSISNDISVEERIRQLDNKLKQDLPKTRPDYSKFLRRKKGDSSNNSQVSTPLSAPCSGSFSLLSSSNDSASIFPPSDTSEFMKSMLSSKPSSEPYSSVQSLVSNSVIQPLTISTGDISTPSSLSSPGSVSLPARNQFTSINVSGPVAMAVSATSHGSVTQRMNCKVDPDYPVKSILKKDNPSPVNNNNNTYQCYPIESNVTQVCQRVQRPLSSLNPNTPRSNALNGSNSTHRYNGSLNSPVLSTPPLRSSDSGSVHSPLFPITCHTVTPLHSPSLNAAPTSKWNVQRPTGQTLPSAKPNESMNQAIKFTSTTNALSTNTINALKRKAVGPDESKRPKASKLESRSSLDESLFSPVVPTKKKKIKSESTMDDHPHKLFKKSSEMLDCSKPEDVSKHSFEIKTESHKEKKYSSSLSEERIEKERRKKEKSQNSILTPSYSKEATIKKLFGNCDDLDRKKEKKRHKEIKQEKIDEKQKKRERKAMQEKEKCKEKSRLSSLTENVDSNKSKKIFLTDDEKKIEHNNSDSDDGWKMALAVLDPYESMYDKIKRRTSKEAEKKHQPSMSDYLKPQDKKSRSKHRKSKVYGSDANLSDSVQSSATNEASSRSISKKSKTSKSSKSKQSKRLDLSDDELLGTPISSKKVRLDDETDDSEMYSSSKMKKKVKKIDECSSKRKQDYFKKTKKSRLKDEKLKKKSCSMLTKKKGLISVDSVFSDSDTSRASSPVCPPSIHDHSSNESKTTPSTDPMDNSETESHSNIRKTSEDEWKMIISSSPIHDLVHSKNELVEKENEPMTIPEDLPCLEKQPDEEIIANSPCSIDDEPPDHLESMYDSPPPPPVSLKDTDTTKESFNDSESKTNEDEAEQSLAVASILKTEPAVSSSGLDCSVTSPTISTAPSIESSSPVRSPLKEIKFTPFEKLEPLTKEPEPPSLPPEEAFIPEATPIEMKMDGALTEFSVPSILPFPAVTQKSSMDWNVQIPVSSSQVTKPNSWEMNIKQSLAHPKSAQSSTTVVSISNIVPVCSVSSTSSVPTSTSKPYVSNDSAPSVHATKSSRNIDTAHDAQDYTSYVQSVIERVKQEKDEESHHSRDKTIKRQKKYTSNVSSSQSWSNSQAIPERRQSSGSTMSSKKPPDSNAWSSVSSLPSIPGVNACTPVSLAKQESLTIPITGNNKSTFLTTSSVLGSGVASSVFSNVTSQQVAPILGLPMQFSVNPTAVPLLAQQTAQIAPIIGSHLTTIPHETIRESFDNALLQTSSPHCAKIVQPEDLKCKKRTSSTGRSSGSFSKADKADTLDETIKDVLRKDREHREDTKRLCDQSGNNSIISETKNEPPESVSDDKNHHPIDPYEPDFDDSPLQINLNRDLHRHRTCVVSQGVSLASSESTCVSSTVTTSSASSVTALNSGQQQVAPHPPPQQLPPPQFINTFASTVSTTSSCDCSPTISNTVTESIINATIPVTTTAATTTTMTTTTKAIVDSVDQVINDVVLGHFDVDKYMTYFKNTSTSTEEERNAFNITQDSSSSASAVDFSDHSNISKQLQQQQQQQRDQHAAVLNNTVPFTMANLLNFSNRSDILNNPMVLTNQIQMIPYQQLSMPNNLSNQVQIPGVNTQAFTTTLSSFDERNLSNLHNTLTSLNININNQRQSGPSAIVSTAVTLPPSSTSSQQGLVSQNFDPTPPNSNNSGIQAMPSPVLISRPSSNPTGRHGGGVYISTTPDHTSPLSSTTRNQAVHNGPSSNPTGQSPNAAFNPGPFEGPTNPAGAIEYLNLLYQQHKLAALQHPAVAAAVAKTTGAASPAIMLNYQANFRTPTPDGRPASQSSHNNASSSTPTQFLSNPLQQSGQQQPVASSTPDTSGYENSIDKLQSLDPRFRKVWKGRLALKNEEVHVEMNFVHGNNDLIKECMNMAGHSFDQPLKIVQRMRLELSQLEGVQRKMQQDCDYCMCLALASSNGVIDLAHMSAILRETFIKYLQEKVAAGIINVSHQEYQQAYVVHIFPPCDFSNNQLEVLAPNLYKWITEHSVPHLLVVITTV